VIALLSDSLGEIVGFIEGPWVSEIADFARDMQEHEQRAWKERNAPHEADEIAKLKNQFGL
jgi:hypothetical protein